LTISASLYGIVLANLDQQCWTQGFVVRKSLVGRQDLGSPGRFVVKRVVGQVKALAREYAQRLGDPAFLREIERAFQREEQTVQKRLATGAARQ
jgi:hypothetical protein